MQCDQCRDLWGNVFSSLWVWVEDIGGVFDHRNVSADPCGWALLIGAGLLGGLAHIASTEAVARSPISALAVFDYTGLIWAMLFDLLLFSHVPTPLSWLGIIAIAAAALFGAWRPKPVAV